MFLADAANMMTPAYLAILSKGELPGGMCQTEFVRLGVRYGGATGPITDEKVAEMAKLSATLDA